MTKMASSHEPASPKRITRRPDDGGPAADSHDLIRVQGARENNLKDVTVAIRKWRLTVVAARSTLAGEHLAAFVGRQPSLAGS